MLLMDTLGHAARLLADARRNFILNPRIDPTPVRPDDPALRIYGEMTRRLIGVPRFVFDNRAIETAVELTLGRPLVLREAIRHLTIPYPAMWVEWDDVGRHRLREKFTIRQYRELRPDPGRVGFLLEADALRRGTATWVWTTPKGPSEASIPSVGAYQPYFDLDGYFPISNERMTGLLGGNIANLWADNARQLEALFDLWRLAEHRPSEWGEQFLAMTSDRLHRELAFADVFGEWIQLLACLLLLTSARPIVRLEAVDQGRLNKARAKRREVPLFDHTRVILDLKKGGKIVAANSRGPLGHARKSPRIHLVSSYLSRRGDKHWIVMPYLRGQGEVIHRHVDVRG